MKSGLYRGYSSFQFMKNKTFKLNDVELVKMDLLNHLFTRTGERVMQPNFGTSIPDLTFEPMDDQTISDLEEEIIRVMDFDPRVEMLDIVLVPDYQTGSITAHVKLEYIELGLVDTFDLNIQFEGSVA